jgi:hypothetical protein
MEMDDGKKERISHLAGGAIVGALVGLFLKNVFLWSSMGIIVGVLWWTRKSGDTQNLQTLK